MLDVPGGARRVNELLAFFKIEEEDRAAERKAEEQRRELENIVNQRRR